MDKLPADKIAEYRESFNMFDVTKSGLLTQSSLAAFCRKINLRISNQAIEDVFNEIDTGGSGTIDFQEFVLFMEKVRQADNYQYFLKVSFDIFDKAGKGALDADCIVKTMADMGVPFTEADAKAVIDSLDLTHSGTISFESFIHLMGL